MDEIQSAKINDDKKEHPIENANVVSRIFFCWLIPYFTKGLRHEYTEDDMYGPLKTHEAERLGDELEVAWTYEVTNKKNPSLWRAIVKVFIRELVLYGIIYAFLELFVRLSQPLVLSHLLKYYEPNQTEATKNEACIYSIILVLMSFLNVVCIHNYMYCVFHLGMKLRVAVCSLIYRKALRLSKSALAVTTIGQMVNLLSNDVDRFDFAATHLHTLWVAPIETLIVTFLLYSYVGPTGLVGTVFLLLFIPFQKIVRLAVPEIWPASILSWPPGTYLIAPRYTKFHFFTFNALTSSFGNHLKTFIYKNPVHDVEELTQMIIELSEKN